MQSVGGEQHRCAWQRLGLSCSGLCILKGCQETGEGPQLNDAKDKGIGSWAGQG